MLFQEEKEQAGAEQWQVHIKLWMVLFDRIGQQLRRSSRSAKLRTSVRTGSYFDSCVMKGLNTDVRV